jgi:hypothetical protein
MVVLDAVVVVEIVDHDAEGFLDRTELGVAEPVDPAVLGEAMMKFRSLSARVA